MPLSTHQVELRSRRLKLLLLDVDGVLTDGTVLVGAESGEAKSFSIRDGAAMVWAQRSGLPIGLLTGRPSEATNRRAFELGVEIVIRHRAGQAGVVRPDLAGPACDRRRSCLHGR